MGHGYSALAYIKHVLPYFIGKPLDASNEICQPLVGLSEVLTNFHHESWLVFLHLVDECTIARNLVCKDLFLLLDLFSLSHHLLVPLFQFVLVLRELGFQVVEGLTQLEVLGRWQLLTFAQDCSLLLHHPNLLSQCIYLSFFIANSFSKPAETLQGLVGFLQLGVGLAGAIGLDERLFHIYRQPNVILELVERHPLTGLLLKQSLNDVPSQYWKVFREVDVHLRN